MQIDAASAKGGGRVTVAKGVCRCGNAIPDRHVYRYAGMKPYTDTRKAFIFAEGATNIAITGKGTVDCRVIRLRDKTKKFDTGRAAYRKAQRSSPSA